MIRFTLTLSQHSLCKGVNIPLVQSLVELAKPARVIVAGGIAAAGDLATLDRIGADAQVSDCDCALCSLELSVTCVRACMRA